MPTKKIITDIKELPFQERAEKYQEELKPLMEKWGIAPWAGLQSSNEMIAAVPMLKDMWQAAEEPKG